MLSKALVWYYTSEYNNRFFQIFDELNCPQNNGALRNAIHNKMNGFFEKIWELGLLESLGGKPSEEVNDACCQAFANYIMSMIS